MSTTDSTTVHSTDEDNRTTEAAVGKSSQMAPGTMKMAKVGERRVVVIRTESGFHALDNACPHQGYGLATGALDGELITCQWHNWKFRVSDGACVIGEEDVACHQVRVEDDDVIVAVTEPSDDEKLASLWPSLQRGVERDYRGQIARDTARLLQAGASPEELIALGLRHSLPRTEWGMGHDMAVAADLLVLADDFDGIDKTLPLTHALAGFSESARDRSPHGVPEIADVPATQNDFVQSIEREDPSGAVNSLRALLRDADLSAAVPVARQWFIDAVSRHHYNYGHGAIYTQKAFTLIERIPEVAELLLTELALTLVYGTREDTLPYMRKADKAIAQVDLEALATAPVVDATPNQRLVDVLLDASEAPIQELVDAAVAGAGVEGIVNAVSLAAAHRMLRFDLAIERNRHEEFGWLDITHAMTYANAARWAWRVDPGPHAARLALLTAFLAFDTGRAERRFGIRASQLPTPLTDDGSDQLMNAVLERRPDVAVARALAGPAQTVAGQLEHASLEDTAGSFIVSAHLIKTSIAAREEASATGSLLPLAAAARFLAAPRAERFVTIGAREAINFVRTGRPPTR